MVHSGGLTINTPWGVFQPLRGIAAVRLGPNFAGARLVEQWSSPPSLARYKKTLHCMQCRFFVYGALGWIRTTDRPVRSRVLYPAELRVLYCLLSEAAYYR